MPDMSLGSLGRFPGESAFSTPERVLSRREQLERLERIQASPGLSPSQRASVKVINDARKRRLDATTVGVLGQPQGVDLTQVGALNTLPSDAYFRPVVTTGEFEQSRRSLSDYLSQVGDPITTGHSDTTLPAIDASSILGTPGTPGTPPRSSIFGPDVTLGATPGGPSVGELDDSDAPMSAADVHGAALDAMGNIDRGNVAATGVDLESTAHMDDIARGLNEITQLLRTMVQRQAYNTPGTTVPDAQPEEFDTGLVQMTRGTRPDQRRGARGTSERRLLPGESRNVPIEEQSDESDDDVFSAFGDDDDGSDSSAETTDDDGSDSSAETTDDDDPSTDEENEPAPAPAQAGSGAVAVSRQLDVEARAEAAEALRRAPGIMKLIETRIFKFNDFLTNGSLDPRKLNKVRRVLAKRVDSTAESYKLAASARGYDPSGAAFPIEGI
eukprot:COSAG02_NODE_7887_length_2808_cov_2.029575_4_plen_441_part_01